MKRIIAYSIIALLQASVSLAQTSVSLAKHLCRLHKPLRSRSFRSGRSMSGRERFLPM